VVSLFEVNSYFRNREIYLIMEAMDGDLQQFICRTKQDVLDVHIKCFIKQLLEGIKALHSLGIYHRDIKPSNILISVGCELRICGFGLSRFADTSSEGVSTQVNPAMQYITSDWYRSPELLISPRHQYDEKMDLWGTGCIMAELVLRRPLFPGRSQAEQVYLIMEVLGFSDHSQLGIPVSAENVLFLNNRCVLPPQNLFELFSPHSSEDFISLLTALLSINPYKRPTAVDALTQPYLADAMVLYDYSVDYFVSK